MTYSLNNIYICLFSIFVLVLFIIVININKRAIEGLINNNSILLNKNAAFCETHCGKSGKLNNSCGKLTNNCNSTSCCVWNSESKCVAGSAFNGKPHTYYFKNKCYGSKCQPF